MLTIEGEEVKVDIPRAGAVSECGSSPFYLLANNFISGFKL